MFSMQANSHHRRRKLVDFINCHPCNHICAFIGGVPSVPRPVCQLLHVLAVLPRGVVALLLPWDIQPRPLPTIRGASLSSVWALDTYTYNPKRNGNSPPLGLRTFFIEKKSSSGKSQVKKYWIRSTRGKVTDKFLRLIPNLWPKILIW